MDSRVLGVDPSLTATGLALPSGKTLTINTKASDGDDRLFAIEDVLKQFLHGALRPQLAVIEDLPTHAHGAGITGMVQGVIRLTLIKAGVPYVIVPAATLKKYATGRGNATKPDMRMALYQRADLDLRDDNQVDAWWLRSLGHDYLGEPVLKLPQTHLAALDKVKRGPDLKPERATP